MINAILPTNALQSIRPPHPPRIMHPAKPQMANKAASPEQTKRTCSTDVSSVRVESLPVWLALGQANKGWTFVVSIVCVCSQCVCIPSCQRPNKPTHARQEAARCYLKKIEDYAVYLAIAQHWTLAILDFI